MLVTCLLTHCKHHHDDVTTLFQLLRVFTTRHVKSFHFLTSYLENDVAKLYPIAEKRVVFFKFVELFTDTEFPQELKGKVGTNTRSYCRSYTCIFKVTVLNLVCFTVYACI